MPAQSLQQKTHPLFGIIKLHMLSHAPCFRLFTQPISHESLPERFTFPFYYTPHPLCVQAANELQHHLTTQTQWQHNFGLTGELKGAIGKMFGVLLVQNIDGDLGYLAAFSGKLADQNLLPHFVPPVFDILSQDSFFASENQTINQLNQQIDALENEIHLHGFATTLSEEMHLAETSLAAHRALMVTGRQQRKAQRAQLTQYSQSQATAISIKLSQASVHEKNQLKALKQYWSQRTAIIQQQLSLQTDKLTALQQQRKQLSAALQQKLFKQYRFLNRAGESKSLHAIFRDSAEKVPPAGAGECAAPKLLHYAFSHQLTPLAMAEFWWGAPPKSAVRQHQQFYPACLRKCQPILAHMLQGIAMDDNPLLTNPAAEKHLDIIYQDDAMVIINKPAELLSVPGKTIQDCVYSRMQQAFPQATGPLIVHRLDMSTSGLMVIALTKAAHKILQKQFISRHVTKRYVALLANKPQAITAGQCQGQILLPLRGDLDDRPKQLVCHEFGKPADTHWQMIPPTPAEHPSYTRVYLYPKTGRTHQLRVHCAHAQGLNSPILGDDLYGAKGLRLHLHADLLQLTHPVSRKLMRFQVDAEF